MLHMRPFSEFEEHNLTFLTQKNVEFTLVQITSTGYKKSILDATDPMRQYFKDHGMHDYALQCQGQEHKVFQPTAIIDESSIAETATSLYRPETKKGDPRLWTNGLKKYCCPNDILLMLYHDNLLYVVNVTKVDIAKVCNSRIITPLKNLIGRVNAEVMSTANELVDLLKEMAQKGHPSQVLADTGIGRAIESLLGVEMNNSKLPDYKGIELKSLRDEWPGIRPTLFCQVPDWKNSAFKSAKEIVEKYGYPKPNDSGQMVKTYQNTLYCNKVNSQSLGLTLFPLGKILSIEEKKEKKDANSSLKYVKIADVAQWQLPLLHRRLLEKHHETFWIEVESRKECGKELFRPTLV